MTDCGYCDHPRSDHTPIRCHGGDTSDADGRLIETCQCLEYVGGTDE